MLEELCPSTLKTPKHQTMCKTDKLLFVFFLCADTKHPSSIQSAEWGSGFLWFCWNAIFMWKQSLGPSSPSVVTEDNKIHNICHLLTLFGVTDLLLIHGLPTRAQLERMDPTASLGLQPLAHILSFLSSGRSPGAGETLTTAVITAAHSCRMQSMNFSLFSS